MTQEVFFQAYRALSRFKGQAAFKTWLHRIALNICLNELRRRRRRPLLAFFAVEELGETLPGAELRNGHTESFSNQDLLRRSLERIKPEEQEALYLREVEAYGFAEIANVLGIGLSAAKMRVYRARLALQKALTEIDSAEVKL